MNKHGRVDADREQLAAELLPPLIPPGTYTAHTTHAEVRRLFNRRTLVVTCELVEPLEFDGLRLSWYCPLPIPRQRPPAASKFALAWVIATGRRPDRGERPAYQDLVDRRLKVVVATVTTSWERDHEGRPIPLPVAAHHSVVKAIIDRAPWPTSPPHAR